MHIFFYLLHSIRHLALVAVTVGIGGLNACQSGHAAFSAMRQPGSGRISLPLAAAMPLVEPLDQGLLLQMLGCLALIWMIAQATPRRHKNWVLSLGCALLVVSLRPSTPGLTPASGAPSLIMAIISGLALLNALPGAGPRRGPRARRKRRPAFNTILLRHLIEAGFWIGAAALALHA